MEAITIYQIALGLAAVTGIVISYAAWNLMKKIEKAEDILVNYLDYLDKISKVIELSDKRITELDHSGAYETDDELGIFFKTTKDLQSILNQFTMKNTD